MDWTQIDFQNAANAIVILLGFILTALGISQGRKKVTEDEKPLELAGAVIDQKQAEKLVEAVQELVTELRAHGRMMDSIHDDLKDARYEVRDLVKEIIRAARKE